MRYLKTLITIASIVGLAATANGQDFPSKPVHMFISAGPGGMTDTTGRIIAAKMEEILGQTVVVENRGGGAGMKARAGLASGEADGYTFVSSASSHAAGAVISQEDYRIDELRFIGSIMNQERVLFASPNAPFSTLEEMWEYGKSNPITVANAGPWPGRVISGMGVEKDLKLRIIPFKSGAETSAALLGGHVMIAETGVGTTLWATAKEQGDVKILATLSDKEYPLAQFGMNDVRSLGQAGISNTVVVHHAFAAPADAPEDRVAVLEAALKAVVEDPEVIAQFQKFDLTPTWLNGEETEALFRKTMANVETLRDLLANQ